MFTIKHRDTDGMEYVYSVDSVRYFPVCPMTGKGPAVIVTGHPHDWDGLIETYEAALGTPGATRASASFDA